MVMGSGLVGVCLKSTLESKLVMISRNWLMLGEAVRPGS